MNILVIGGGYVGLTTAVGFAYLHNDVIVVENDTEKFYNLLQGKTDIYDSSLGDMLHYFTGEGKITYSKNVESVIDHADYIFLCVGTPTNPDGSTNFTQLDNAITEIAKNLNSYKIIIEKSTVPVGTHKRLKKLIDTINPSANYDIVSNPEFLREGSATTDFIHPDRIIIGTNTEKAYKLMNELYKSFDFIYNVDIETAELIKYVANGYLGMRLSYINMVSELCDKLGIDIDKVAKGVGMDHRIGQEYFKAGIGYGGSCLSKDIKSFIHTAEEHNIDFDLMNEVQNINIERISYFIRKIMVETPLNQDTTIAMLGLSFKADTNDVRDSPSIKLIHTLRNIGCNLRLTDPKAIKEFKKIYNNSSKLNYFDDVYECVKGVDIVIIATDWWEYQKLDFSRVKTLMASNIIADARNCLDKHIIEKYGLKYIGLGK